VNIGSIQRMNHREVAGQHVRSSSSLQDLIIEHLDLVREMEKLDAYEEVICRMVVEGFTQGEIARECGISVWSVARRLSSLRWTLYGYGSP
jgi:DNA-directed RNA polymerase specialized sigma24 family protein